MLGNGNGTFGPASFLATDKFAAGVAVADFNGDGKLDIVTANRLGGNFTGNISLLLGNGNGTFKPHVEFSIGFNDVGVAVADLNGDGKQDLVVTDDSGTGDITVALGNGNGTFAAGKNYSAGSYPFAATVTDLNGDGKQDIMIASTASNQVLTLLGNGNGTFQSAISQTVPAGPEFIAVADINGDGQPDYATANYYANSVSVLLGNNQFILAGPTTATAGTAFSLTFTAEGPFSNVLTGYRGTIHFSSSDPKALLPVDYTFTAADAGVHTFTNAFTLETAGSQSVTGTDTLTPSFTGSTSVTVSGILASQLGLAAPLGSKAGKPITITISALDPYGNLDPTYRGTVHFTSSDSKAKLPADYTFTASDAGVHTFTRGFTLKTSGNQFITGTDTVKSTITGQAKIHVKAAGASHYTVTGPSSVVVGIGFQITVTALDAFGNVATTYRGIVHFSSTDPSAGLPFDYQFVGSDQGIHTFTMTLNTIGTQTVTATDTVQSHISGTVTITVTSSVSPLPAAKDPEATEGWQAAVGEPLIFSVPGSNGVFIGSGGKRARRLR
jgi:hypothetical protein